MFEVGFTEIVLILGLALLVLGPEKLPGLAEKVGRWTGRARAMARQLRTQLEQEVNLEELAKSRPIQPADKSSSDPSAHATEDAAPPAATTEQTGVATEETDEGRPGAGSDLDEVISGTDEAAEPREPATRAAATSEETR